MKRNVPLAVVVALCLTTPVRENQRALAQTRVPQAGGAAGGRGRFSQTQRDVTGSRRADAPAPTASRREIDWERLSWISTTIGFVITALGLIAVVIQLSFQGRQTRLEFLNRLYGELDTDEARAARATIYRTPPEELQLAVLHASGNEEKRRVVEGTLATFERLAYPIVQKQVPAQDAFNLYGGVLLSIARQLWPYVEQQREMRKQGGLRHRLGYRRFLEAVIHDFAPKYVKAAGLPPLPPGLPTKELLRRLFPDPRRAA